MHAAEAGEGPLVLLLHGFPMLWYSFRHQLGALAEAGYRAVAPDERGDGATDAPPAVHDYTLMHLAGDIVGLFHALDEDPAVVEGQDWGSPVATTLALFRPDLVRGLVMLSTPYFPWGDTDFLSELTAKLGSDNYQEFFQEPGVAEAALEADVRATVLGALLGISGEAAELHTTTEVNGTTAMPDYSHEVLPDWRAKLTSTITPPNSAGPATGAHSTGTATTAKTGSTCRPGIKHQSKCQQCSWVVSETRFSTGLEREHWWTRLATASFPTCVLGHPGRLRPLDPPGTTGRDERSLARVLGGL